MTRICLFCIVLAMVSGVNIPSAHAYRPFTSTDAAVAKRGELEIEWGLFSFSREKDEDVIRVPSLIINLGITHAFETIFEFKGEFIDEEAGDGFQRTDSEFAEAGLFAKGIFNQGSFGGKKGWFPTFGAEAGLLLPTEEEDRKLGLEAFGIASGWLGPFIYHLNLGGLLDKEDNRAEFLWGLIMEYPLLKGVRLVGEINGETVSNESPDNSALLGFIWESPWKDIAFDFGYRFDLSQGAPEWEVTMGLTFSFNLGKLWE